MALTHWMYAAALAGATAFGGCTKADLRLADEIAEGYGLEPGEPVVEQTGETYEVSYAGVMRDIEASRGGRPAPNWNTVHRFGIHPGDQPAAGAPWNFPWYGTAHWEPGPDGRGPVFDWPEDEAPAPAPPEPGKPPAKKHAPSDAKFDK